MTHTTPATPAEPAKAKRIAGNTIFNWAGYDMKQLAVESPSGNIFFAFMQGTYGEPDTWTFAGLAASNGKQLTNKAVLDFVARNYDALNNGANPCTLN